MKKQNNLRLPGEKGPGERLTSIALLALISIFIALASLVIMDALIYPIAVFAVKEKAAFSSLVRWAAGIGLIIILAVSLTRSVLSLVKNGNSPAEAAFFLARKPLNAALISVGLITALVAVSAVVALILRVNSSVLNRIWNG